MRTLYALAALTLFACNGEDKDPVTDTEPLVTDDSDDTTDTEPSDTEESDESESEVEACTAEIDTITPRDAAINVEVGIAPSVTFTAAVEATDVSLEIDGVDGAMALASDGMSATFTPTAELDYETDYELVVEVCDDGSTTEFKTSSAPIDESELIGRVYVLDMDEVSWEAPTLAALVAGDLTFEYLLLEVLEYDETTEELAFSGAVGVTAGGQPAQARCYPVLDFSDVDFSSNPNFVLGPEDFSVPMDASTDVTMEDFTFSGAFNSDGDALESIEITALLDTEPLDDLVSTKLGMNTCDASSTFFGEDCIACDDGDETCLETLVTADEALWVEGLDIDETYNPDTDSGC